MNTTAQDALRADIRLLGDLLGETLYRLEGQQLLDLVEEVRSLSKQARKESGQAASRLHALLAGLDLELETSLVRAFSAYFHLANIAEQVHRADERPALAGAGISLRDVVDRILAAGVPRSEITSMVNRFELRPVWTAHPTESVRQSILIKRQHVAVLLEQLNDTRLSDNDRLRVQRRLAETIDLLWQTDELRRDRPSPVDEARNVLFYLDRVFRAALPELLDDFSIQLGRLGVELPSGARPLRFGTWVGGDRDGNPNVTPQVTLEVLALQREVALQNVIDWVDELLSSLSNSTRLIGVSSKLEASL
ncbi:MAG: phosphoenolpyruvate carboxylase, partial [Actinobacteria bacterium]|nr:phosphoenolpyruvate carboxylase [Actinomycetota bacterium]